jgi:Xaa-Pro dipeptidase
MDYDSRVMAFQELAGEGVDLIYFPISADLQYLTGVPRDFPNFGAVLHPGAWIEGLWMAPGKQPVLTLPRMTAEFGGLEDSTSVELRVLGDWDDPAALVKDVVKHFGLTQTNLHIAIGDRALGETVSRLHGLFPDATFHSGTDMLRPLRMIKGEDEIEVMREAGAITEAAFADVLTKLKHGMTELDIIAEVDYQLCRHGALGPSFTTALYNVGPNHELIWGNRESKWHRELHPPVSILFDMGAIHNGYCYDFGRTVAFGAPDADFQRVYDLVMQSQRAGIEAMRAGQATAEAVDAAARKVIEDAGYGKEFRHRLGHSIGLDVHEPPFLTSGDETVLQEGMLFTVEPSILIEGQCSARVEDVVVARPDGGEPLTTGFQPLYVVE